MTPIKIGDLVQVVYLKEHEDGFISVSYNHPFCGRIYKVNKIRLDHKYAIGCHDETGSEYSFRMEEVELVMQDEDVYY